MGGTHTSSWELVRESILLSEMNDLEGQVTILAKICPLDAPSWPRSVVIYVSSEDYSLLPHFNVRPQVSQASCMLTQACS